MAIYKAGRPNKYNPTSGVGQKPPAKPGEYRMRDGNGTITYIGETNNLARRFREHIRSGKLPVGNGCNSTIEYMVADGRSTSRTRRGHEQHSIAKHNPLFYLLIVLFCVINYFPPVRQRTLSILLINSLQISSTSAISASESRSPLL